MERSDLELLLDGYGEVEGVEMFEDAQLLREISSCNEFSMRGVRDRMTDKVSLLTMFDNIWDCK